MSAILIVLFLLVGVVVAASLALGRATHEVERVGDNQYVELEDAWVRYSVRGGGPPVVLVHGWLSSSRVWEGLAGRLAQRFTVYTLDLTGFGESDKPLSGYGVRYGSRLLYSFCAHFGLTRANVIAHDIGGDMAVKLAADHPDIVGRLVLVSTPADDDQIDLPTALWLATLPVIGPLFYALGRMVRPVRRLWMRPFVLDPADLTEEVVDDAGRSTPAAVAETLNVGRREISRGRLARQARIIRIPTLLVAGEDDQIVDPQAVGAWADSIERSEVCLIDGCGHLPMLERIAEFNAHILAFLTGDARYLDYAAPPAPDKEQAEPSEDARRMRDASPAEQNGEASYDRAAYDEDVPRVSSEGGGGPAEDAATPAEEPPRVRRKQGGVYPAGDREPAPPSDVSPSNGTENGAEERRSFRDRRGMSGSGGDGMPELPADLFDWPEPHGHERPRRRYRGDRSDRGDAPSGDDGPDASPEPPAPPRF